MNSKKQAASFRQGYPVDNINKSRKKRTLLTNKTQDKFTFAHALQFY
jgi:hypothetical protein